jgi:hypothetical protein
VHAPLQIVPPLVHWHCPPEQAAPVAVHPASQAPQLVMLLVTSVQPPPQSIWPVGQTHEPFWQVWLSEHLWPQAPQLLESVVRARQVPLQLVSPLGHVDASPASPASAAPPSLRALAPPQLPATHAVPDAHPWPHDPQLAGSSWMSTQAWPQSVLTVLGQTHEPPTQSKPCAQALPQLPQFAGSRETSVQRLPHCRSVARGQHSFPVHVLGSMHTCP